MEPKGSFPHSQVSATCPSPEPAPTSPTPSSQFLKIHLNIIPPSTPGSSKLFRVLRFTHQNPLFTSPLPQTCYMSHLLILLDFITRIIFDEEYRSLSSSLCSFLHSPVTLVPLRSKYSPQHPILKHPQTTFLPQCEGPSFTPIYKTPVNTGSHKFRIWK